ncbi:PDZ domain-containing protein [Magnetococcales bacterium HHB-1]
MHPFSLTKKNIISGLCFLLLLNTGSVCAAWLGVQVVPSPGIRIERVIALGPAEEAGLKDNDIILDINGIQPQSINHFVQIMAGLNAGQKVTVSILRNRQIFTIPITLKNPEIPRPPWSQTYSQQAYSSRPQNNPAPLWVGIATLPAHGGLIVHKLNPQSPGARAGLLVNDLLLSADGHPLTSNETLQQAIQRHSPGERLVLGIQRNGLPLTLHVTLETRITP